jgi:hypothetical protein
MSRATTTLQERFSTRQEEVCVECFENPCFFFHHEELLVAVDEAEHGMIPAGEDVPSNNV